MIQFSNFIVPFVSLPTNIFVRSLFLLREPHNREELNANAFPTKGMREQREWLELTVKSVGRVWRRCDCIWVPQESSEPRAGPHQCGPHDSLQGQR